MCVPYDPSKAVQNSGHQTNAEAVPMCVPYDPSKAVQNSGHQTPMQGPEVSLLAPQSPFKTAIPRMFSTFLEPDYVIVFLALEK